MPTYTVSATSAGVATVGGTATVRGAVHNYLRALLDDQILHGSASAPFWDDAELTAALSKHRRAVTLADFASETIHDVPSAAGTRYASAYTSSAPFDPTVSVLSADPDFKTFRAQDRYRFWASSPTPVIFVGGVKVTGSGDWTYTVDHVAGSVTFSEVDGEAGAAISAVYPVQASFAYYPLYEVAYELITVAMGQWASVAMIDRAGTRMQRADLEKALKRVCMLRDLGQPRTVPMGKILR
jgi:hypothetical protein